MALIVGKKRAAHLAGRTGVEPATFPVMTGTI